ncbi:hypothetical protein HN51_066817 [Arachis hypogaea]
MYLFRKIASDCSMYLFIVGEHVENYHYHYCWHNVAIKYLSLMERSEILCIQLKRVHMNNFGEPIKLQDTKIKNSI